MLIRILLGVSTELIAKNYNTKTKEKMDERRRREIHFLFTKYTYVSEPSDSQGERICVELEFLQWFLVYRLGIESR